MCYCFKTMRSEKLCDHQAQPQKLSNLWLFLKNPVDHRMDVAALLFLILLSIAVGITGYLGGELVMTHGVGVGLQ